MRFGDLKPAPGEAEGVARGAVLSLVLHPIALVAVAIAGAAIDARDGALIVLPFLAFIGLSEWVYLAPVAWLLRRRGKIVAAKGVVMAGMAIAVANVLFYGAVGLRSWQYQAESRRIQEYERAHPSDYISTNGIVTVVDDKHFEFTREDDGRVVSLLTWQGLDYVFLKKDGGYEKRTREILKPGVRISVEYDQERGKPPVSPTIVRVYEGSAR